jgi:hypothetical protein
MQNLNNEGIEITQEEVEKYLPDNWYLLPLEEMENCVFYGYLGAEAKKESASEIF